MTTSSSRPRGPALCPVLCGATRRPASTAARTTSAVSSAFVGKATAAGRWSTARFHGVRASSKPGSPGQQDGGAAQHAQCLGARRSDRAVERVMSLMVMLGNLRVDVDVT